MSRKRIAKESLRITGLFESELLTELILRQWNHPLANDSDYRMGLLEGAADVLHACINGEQLIEGVPPEEMNLVAALWVAEWTTLTSDPFIDEPERDLRRIWLDTIRRSVPSCFCNQELLDNEMEEM